MVRLFRVTHQNDTYDSQTFTFILPTTTSRTDDFFELSSGTFAYGGQTWRLFFMKTGTRTGNYVLEPHLECNNLDLNAKCTCDVTMLLINRQSFTKNIVIQEKKVEFGTHKAFCLEDFVSLKDLQDENFTDARGEYLFEVELRNCLTVIACGIQLSHDPNTSKDPLDYQTYDTQVFSFGALQWSCVFCPNMNIDKSSGLQEHMLQIVRKTQFDCLCQLTYRLALIVGAASLKRQKKPEDQSPDPDSPAKRPVSMLYKFLCEERSEIFDFGSCSSALYFTEDYLACASTEKQLLFSIELKNLIFINQAKLNVISVIKQPTAQIFDKDRQAWRISTAFVSEQSRTTDEEYFYVQMRYMDADNVPRNRARYVSWSMKLLPQGLDKQIKPISIGDRICEKFYSSGSTSSDKFFTNLKMKELQVPDSCWLHKIDQRLLIQIEWFGSHLLFEHCYNAYDDVYRKQIKQMRTEMQMLHKRNNELERQLYLHQMSVSEKNQRRDSDWEASGPSTPVRAASISSVSGITDNVLRSLLSPAMLAVSLSENSCDAKNQLNEPDDKSFQTNIEGDQGRRLLPKLPKDKETSVIRGDVKDQQFAERRRSSTKVRQRLMIKNPLYYSPPGRNRTQNTLYHPNSQTVSPKIYVSQIEQESKWGRECASRSEMNFASQPLDSALMRSVHSTKCNTLEKEWQLQAKLRSNSIGNFIRRDRWASEPYPMNLGDKCFISHSHSMYDPQFGLKMARPTTVMQQPSPPTLCSPKKIAEPSSVV